MTAILVACRNAPLSHPEAFPLRPGRHPSTSLPVGTPGSADPLERLVDTPPAQHEPKGPDSPSRRGPKRHTCSQVPAQIGSGAGIVMFIPVHRSNA